jgi:hypothetical protein
MEETSMAKSTRSNVAIGATIVALSTFVREKTDFDIATGYNQAHSDRRLILDREVGL